MGQLRWTDSKSKVLGSGFSRASSGSAGFPVGQPPHPFGFPPRWRAKGTHSWAVCGLMDMNRIRQPSPPHTLTFCILLFLGVWHTVSNTPVVHDSSHQEKIGEESLLCSRSDDHHCLQLGDPGSTDSDGLFEFFFVLPPVDGHRKIFPKSIFVGSCTWGCAKSSRVRFKGCARLLRQFLLTCQSPDR